MNIWKKIKEDRISFSVPFTDALIGKTVIRFTSHGCIGQIDKFDYIGKIVDLIYHNNKKFYKVEVLKDKNGEKREGNLESEFREIPSWYLQNIGGDFLITYD